MIRREHRGRLATLAAATLAAPTLGAFCDKPHTSVIVENRYAQALVVYRAAYVNAAFDDPIAPGASSEPRDVVAASSSIAYVVLAPGWSPDAGADPTSLVVLRSKEGFEVHLDTTLRIPIDDTTFAGNCAAGSVLSQEQADFVTQLVFPDVFAPLTYDAATCASKPIGDAGAD
jgi:hypothetical protein